MTTKQPDGPSLFDRTIKLASQLLREVWRRTRLKHLLFNFEFSVLMRQWSSLRAPANARSRSSQSARSGAVLIIPPDPLLLCASKGDEAMLQVVIRRIRSVDPERLITVAVCGPISAAGARELGVSTVMLGRRANIAKDFAAISKHLFDLVYLIGADVLDGSHDPRFSLRLIALSDLCARSGSRVIVTGFSFSKQPFQPLSRAFDQSHESITFQLRDPVSLARFNTFSSARARLVADLAFCLHPANFHPEVDGFRAWIQERANQNMQLVGFNLHPLLLGQPAIGALKRLNRCAVSQLEQILGDKQIALVLIAHDFRGSSADDHCLGPIFDALHERFKERVYYLKEELPAATLKSLIERLDLVICARMHLAIASLGMGVPVLGLNYRDKMEGLIAHFSMSPSLVIAGSDSILGGKLAIAFASATNDLAEHRRSLSRNIENVKRLAFSNFEEAVATPLNPIDEPSVVAQLSQR